MRRNWLHCMGLPLLTYDVNSAWASTKQTKKPKHSDTNLADCWPKTNVGKHSDSDKKKLWFGTSKLIRVLWFAVWEAFRRTFTLVRDVTYCLADAVWVRSRKAAVAITASHSALPRGTKTHVANSRHLPAIVGFDSFLCDCKIKCNETLVLGDGMGGRCIKKKQFFTCCDVMLISLFSSFNGFLLSNRKPLRLR